MQMMDIIDKKNENLNKSIELSDQESEDCQVLQEEDMNLKNSVMPDDEIIKPKVHKKIGLNLMTTPYKTKKQHLEDTDKLFREQKSLNDKKMLKETSIEDKTQDLAKVNYCV